MKVPIVSTIATAARGESPAESLVADVRTMSKALASRWPWIALTVLAALAAAVLFLLLVTPRYTATAQILIDPRAKRIVEGAVVPGGYGSSAAGADTLLVDSQIELIQSSAVLKKIVQSEGLDQDPEFAVPAGASGLRMFLRNTLGQAIFGNDREVAPTTDPVDTAVWRFGDRHLRVRRPGNTYVINITVSSEDAVKAARLANAVAAAYIADQAMSTSATTRDATASLQARIVDLRRNLEATENAVEVFRTRAGLIGSPNLLVTEQQLQQTNDKLILARATAALAKARYDQVKDLSTRGGAALLGAQSDALKSPVIANLRAALSRIERRDAVVQQSLRPGHPEYAGVQVEKRALAGQIEDELARIKANARGEFELAQAAESTLRQELKLLETQTATDNQALVRLRELQREAQSARVIFEQFLNRAKETSEQETLGLGSSRIISQATVPPYPAFPPTLLVFAGAIMAGLTAGSGAAWLAHVYGGSPAVQLADRQAAVVAIEGASARGEGPALAATEAQSFRADARRSAAMATLIGNRTDMATIARLPALAKLSSPDRATPDRDTPHFADYIAAVDDGTASAYPGYREAADTILAQIGAATRPGSPPIAMLIGADDRADPSSTALALAYRSAMQGQNTLLIDVATADPCLSRAFASNLQQKRACMLDSDDDLAELITQDARTGLSMLPLALAQLQDLSPDQQRRLLVGLSKLSKRFDRVVMNAGSASANRQMAFLATMVDRLLVVVTTPQLHNGLLQRQACEAARLFRMRLAEAAIIETSVGAVAASAINGA